MCSTIVRSILLRKPAFSKNKVTLIALYLIEVRALNIELGTIGNELYQVTNLALLCEDIVNGMIAANEYRGTGTEYAAAPLSSEVLSQDSRRTSRSPHHVPVDIIIDIERRDWEFKVQAGGISLIYFDVIY